MKKFSVMVNNELLFNAFKQHAQNLGYILPYGYFKNRNYQFNYFNDYHVTHLNLDQDDTLYKEKCPYISLEEYFALTPQDVKNNLVKLNDSYTAEILEGKIKVGCQTFTFQALEELHQAIQKFK